jgi:tetratricopeptide (TPR) repeat protein
MTTADAIGLLNNKAVAAEEKRRVLKMRQMEGQNINEEYRKAAEAKRLESIRFLKQLLVDGDSTGPRKAEMMLRLADLYFEHGRSIYLGEMAKYDIAYEKCFNTDGCDYETMDPDNAKSSDWQEKSIRLYEQILRNYPRYQRADEATFYLGMALQDLGRIKEAVKKFTALVKTYPDSKMVADSFVNIGEYYFDTNNAYKALLAYKKATNFRESPKYSFALYKLAWCYYNVGEYGKSIEKMKAVVSYTQNDTGGDKRIQLQDEALKDLVRFFADAGEMDAAYEYFSKLGKKDLIQSMLKRLATMYFDQGKFEQCIQTYRRLISENPQSPRSPDYQVEIIKAYKKIGKREETLQEVNRLLKTYGKGSSWVQANASNLSAVKDANASIEKNLRVVAVDYHTHAEKLGRGESAKKTYALAYKAYKLYLNEFSSSSHAYSVRYAFAELLYTVKKFGEAYDQYMAVVKIDANGKKSRFCAESAIFAAEKMVEKEGKSDTRRTKGPVKNAVAQELTDWEKKYVEACKQYATLYPKDKKVRNIIYRTAYLLYNKFRFEEAAEQFKLVIQMDPASREAEQAANLILDSFVVNDDLANLKKNAKFYYEQEGLGSSTFKKQVYKVYQNASFELISRNYKKTDDKASTADAYMAFYAEFVKTAETKTLAAALNNAAFYYKELNRVADSMKVRHILVEDPKFGKNTKYYYVQVAALGYDYETIADFEKAAHYYEMMFGLYPAEKKKLQKSKDEKEKARLDTMDTQAADAIYSAAVFRKASEETSGAIRNYQKFVTAFPADTRVDDVKMTIARTYEDNEDWSKAANAYLAFYSKTKADTSIDFIYFARLRHARALEKMNQKSKATKIFVDTVEMYKKLAAAGAEKGLYTEYAAEMMYDLITPEINKFKTRKITSLGRGYARKYEDRHQAKQLKALNEGAKTLKERYIEVVATGSGQWALASLVQLGRTLEVYAKALEESEVPFYLTEDQKEMYKISLSDMIFPQIENSVGYYKQALDRAYQLTLYTDDTAFAVRRLGELRPDEFPGLEEQIIRPRFTSSRERQYTFETEMK